jgi:hypothetical protein
MTSWCRPSGLHHVSSGADEQACPAAQKKPLSCRPSSLPCRAAQKTVVVQAFRPGGGLPYMRKRILYNCHT